MKFELFKADFGNFWGVRRAGEESIMFFDQYWNALYALTSIESWVNEAAANATRAHDSYMVVNPKVFENSSDVKHTENALKALENYNLAKSDEVAHYENEIRR